MVAPLFVVKRARGFLRSFPLQNDRGVSLSFCTTNVVQKIETTKSKTLFSNILATFFRPPRIFFRRPKNHFLRKRGEAIFVEGKAPCIPPLAPFSLHEFSKSRGGAGAG